MNVILFICSAVLIASGLIGYFGATPDAETGKVSATALIPAWFGLVMLLAALASLKESLRKHAMHLAAVVALLGAIGVGMRLPKVLGGLEGNPDGPLTLGVFLVTLAAFVVFLVAAIRFFVVARILKKNAPPTSPES